MQENYPSLISLRPLKPEFSKFNKIPITSELFTLGRSLENSAVIAFIGISRKHCRFKKFDESDWIIEDLSSFGIIVNNKKLSKGSQHKLSDNDILQLTDSKEEFIYKFVQAEDDNNFEVPRKRLKPNEPDIINNVKLKFDESQSFEMKHIEDKILSTKKIQNTSLQLKQKLELDMVRKINQLEQEFQCQIENLKGEKDEVEKQKLQLQEERDLQLAGVRAEMEQKIAELMDQIQKHNETETELLQENNDLKEKLLKEREDFLAELSRESTSKQDLLGKLEAKIREQEETRLKERKELEDMLRRETELLREATKKEREEMEELKKIKEKELEVERTERAAAEQKLTEAQANAELRLEELRKQVSEREKQLQALATDKMQQQAEQSEEVIQGLQKELAQVKTQLQSVETERNTILESICSEPSEPGPSKQDTLTEVGELLESELQCSICAELFVAATTLNCSHTFCTYCITMWKKKKLECPICRARITSECRSLVLDSFIEKMVQSLTDDMKKKREIMLKDREELNAEVACLNSEGPSRGGGGVASPSSEEFDSDAEWEGEEEDYEYDDGYDYGSRFYDIYGSEDDGFAGYSGDSESTASDDGEHSDGGPDADAAPATDAAQPDHHSAGNAAATLASGAAILSTPRAPPVTSASIPTVDLTLTPHASPPLLGPTMILPETPPLNLLVVPSTPRVPPVTTASISTVDLTLEPSPLPPPRLPPTLLGPTIMLPETPPPLLQHLRVVPGSTYRLPNGEEAVVWVVEDGASPARPARTTAATGGASAAARAATGPPAAPTDSRAPQL